MFKLDGKGALITGGTSGIGKATAEILLKAGGKVVITARGELRGQKVLEELRQYGDTHFISADVSREDQVDELIRRSAEALGSLDFLVNNAGIIDRTPVHELRNDSWNRIIANDLTGVFMCSRGALPYLIQAKGAIVNIASYLAFRGGDGRTPAYNVAKAGVVALTKTMAVAYGPMGVRVNAISPGSVPTELNRDVYARMTKTERQKAVESYPLRRIGTPYDVAHAVLFLCSDEAGWITGITLAVDGGLTA